MKNAVGIPMLQCPGCAYDLRESMNPTGAFRCPECGIVCGVEELVEAALRRERHEHRLGRVALVGGLFFGLLIVRETVDHRRPLGGAVTELELLMIVATFPIGLLVAQCWPAAPARLRIGFALGCAALVLAGVIVEEWRTWMLAPLAAWYLGFNAWALHRRWFGTGINGGEKRDAVRARPGAD